MSSKPQPIWKTRKLFVGGAFVRSESGRVLVAGGDDSARSENYSWASRKDLRDAVSAARTAFDGWAKRTPYLRGQILYRVAEMLQQRAPEFAVEIAHQTGVTATRAAAEVNLSIDRIVHYAGWADKYAGVFSSVNPVATPHFNFTTPEPVGVVAIVCPGTPSLLAAATLIAATILSGNTAVVLASETFPLPALSFAEVLATSDVPGGVVNILAGKRREIAPHVASHMEINSIVDATTDATSNVVLRGGQSLNLKRYVSRRLSDADWFTAKAEDPYWILDTVEHKTAWHPIGV